MKISYTMTLLVLVLANPLSLQAQEGDEKPLKDLSRSYAKGWNGQKAADVAALYAADAILTTPGGETIRGRDAIQSGLGEELGAKRRISFSGEEYRWLSEDAVVWRYEWKISGGESSRGTGLAVLTKTGEGWRIVEDLTALSPAAPAAAAPEHPAEEGDHGHDHGGAGGHSH